MVKLTAELIQTAAQYINPVKDRELDLRGYKVPVIENMGATLDQFDCIDLSDNDIRKLDGFPLLKRLRCLLLNNNRIIRIGEGLGEVLPSLNMLVLTNNHVQELGDLDALAELPSLEYLSLMHNPVSTKPHYRAYLIYRLPKLRVLDFRKIRQKEREAAKILFKSKKGKDLVKELAKTTDEVAPGAEPERGRPQVAHTAEEIRSIRESIAKASSLAEIERLNQILAAGNIPGKNLPASNGKDGLEEEEEMES